MHCVITSDSEAEFKEFKPALNRQNPAPIKRRLKSRNTEYNFNTSFMFEPRLKFEKRLKFFTNASSELSLFLKRLPNSDVLMFLFSETELKINMQRSEISVFTQNRD